MNMLHHGINMNVHEVLDVNMRRQDNGVIIMTIRHKVHDCTENTYGVAAYEMVLFPAEGGILVAPVIDTAKRVTTASTALACLVGERCRLKVPHSTSIWPTADLARTD